MIRESIKKLVDHQDLTPQEAGAVMREIMSGEASQAQIGSFLTALRMKGETITEITEFARTMMEFCIRIKPKVTSRLVDTCGTGGDKLKTFNVSTIASFIVAGAGAPVAKHGNRSVTSRCGSADLLERLGVNLNVDPTLVERTIEKIGIGFMFAPAFHPAMKNAIGPRREIGIRTVFNLLGPLTNPASPKGQLMGVYEPRLVKPIASVLRKLGLEEAMVVHGKGGLDEISTVSKSKVSWLREGTIKSMEIGPRDFGLKLARLEEVVGSTPEENAVISYKILNGRKGPRTDMALANAAAALIVAGKETRFKNAMNLAKESVESGKAYQKLRELVNFTGGSSATLDELGAKYA